MTGRRRGRQRVMMKSPRNPGYETRRKAGEEAGEEAGKEEGEEEIRGRQRDRR